MEKAPVLEHQNAAALGLHINPLFHVPRVESSSAAHKILLAVLAHSVVEVEVQRKVRPLLAIGSFVGAVAMCCFRCIVSERASFEARPPYVPLKYSPPTYFKNLALSFNRVTFQTSFRFVGPLPVTLAHFSRR
jgi:hypothetical protein